MIDWMPGWPDSGRGEVGRVEAAQLRQGRGPDSAVFADQGGQAAEVADGRNDTVKRFVITEKLAGAVEEHLAVACFYDFGDVLGVPVHGDALETAFVRAQGDAVGRADPKLAGCVTIQCGNLIVRQAERIVRAEILVIILNAVFIEPAEGPDPDMAVGVFRKSVYPLVGKPVCDDDVPGARMGSWSGMGPGAGQRQQGEDQ